MRATRAERHREVVLALQDAAAAQDATVEAIRALAPAELRVERFWIVNAVRVEGPAAAVAAAAAHPEVAVAYLDRPIELVAPVGPAEEPDDGTGAALEAARGADAAEAAGGGGGDGPPGGGPEGGTPVAEVGVAAINAPQAWGLGFDGTGVLVATVDTGADGTHPALASRWAGLLPAYEGHPEWAWFDPFTGNHDFPFEGSLTSHGTHVTATVCGGPPGDPVGVAPGARWIAAGSIDRGGGIETTVADAIASFQWLIDPDGDPTTVFDVPHVVSNSWGLREAFGYPDCDELFWSFIDALESAGTVVLFAAGNEGAGGLRRPADRATDDYRTLAVAAVDAGDPSFPVAAFSSRGPTTCTPDGGPAIKPDLAGPGVGVRSAVEGGGYEAKSGTSMATPHVAGVVALVRQVDPDLPVEVVKQILYDAAIDLGPAGEDSDTGHGLVDALAAVEAALETLTLRFELAVPPSLLDPFGGTTVRVVVSGAGVAPAPGTGRLHWRTDGGAWADAPMVEVEPNVYDAVFPPLPCGSVVDWYVSAETAGGELGTLPVAAPDVTFTAEAYSGITAVVALDFEDAAGWMVVNEALEDGQWDRGVPAGGGDRGDPESDWDGSGACWLTDNVDGNSDVDGGPTRLVSPAYDLSGLDDPEVTYARWFTNDDGDQDSLTVEVSGDDGLTWHLVDAATADTPWVRTGFRVLDHLPPSALGAVRVRFSVSDQPNDSVTEAAIDAFSITSRVCTAGQVPGDVTGEGAVDLDDVLAVLTSWGPCFACPADLDGSGVVDLGDLLLVLASFGP